MFVAGVDADQFAHQIGIQVFVIRDLGFVQLFQQTGFDLCFDKHRAGHHDVKTGVAGHQFGLQRFVGFKGLVVDFDAGVFLEIGDQVLGHVIRPVVNIEYFFFGIDSSNGCGGLGFFFFTAGGKGQRGQQDK